MERVLEYRKQGLYAYKVNLGRSIYQMTLRSFIPVERMESSKDSTRPMEMLLVKIAPLATALLPQSKAFSNKIANNKVVVGTSSGELAILSSDLSERNILNIKMKKSIRNLAVGIDQSKPGPIIPGIHPRPYEITGRPLASASVITSG